MDWLHAWGHCFSCNLWHSLSCFSCGIKAQAIDSLVSQKRIETKLLIYLLFSNNHFRLNDIIGGATELIYDIIFEYVDWFVLGMTLYTWCRPDKIWHMDEGTCTATENVLVVFSLFFFLFFFFFFFCVCGFFW